MCDSVLWGNLEHKVYRNNPHILEALHTTFHNTILEAMEGELQCVENLLYWCKIIFLNAGGHCLQ
jgi:hypothetical protein